MEWAQRRKYKGTERLTAINLNEKTATSPTTLCITAASSVLEVRPPSCPLHVINLLLNLNSQSPSFILILSSVFPPSFVRKMAPRCSGSKLYLAKSVHITNLNSPHLIRVCNLFFHLNRSTGDADKNFLSGGLKRTMHFFTTA